MNASNGCRCKSKAVMGGVYCTTHRKKFESVVDVEEDSMGPEMPVVVPILPTRDEIEKIKELEARIAELTSMVKTLTVTAGVVRAPRKMGVDTKALILFYHDYKENTEVLAELEKRNVPYVERTKKDTKQPYKSYNWLKVKQITDEAFKNHSTEELKNVYLEKARQELSKVAKA